MAPNNTVSPPKQQDIDPRYFVPFPRVLHWIRITRFVAIFFLGIFFLANCTSAVNSVVIAPPLMPSANKTAVNRPATNLPAAIPPLTTEQYVQFEVSLLRENLPVYLDFIGKEVLPVMSENIDTILGDLNGLTDISPGLFYHGHIDYLVNVSDGIAGLMEMNNMILQYHTLESPLIYLPYWRQELGNIHDPAIDTWLGKVNTYNQAISTPSAASRAQYTPLSEYEAVAIASKWDSYRVQNGLPSPGIEMLVNMVYMVDGGKQPLYQDAFNNIYKFHSIVFTPDGYLQLDNQTHLENTFSPFQISFETVGECPELLEIFKDAEDAGFRYIVNLHNPYVAQFPEWLNDSEMAQLNMRLNNAIDDLLNDNIIKIAGFPSDQQIAFFSVGNYVFTVYGSLHSPSIFE